MRSSPLRARTARPSTIALILVTGTSALSTDAYLPSMPSLRASLGTSPTVAQLTMTTFLAGLAIGQLASGPVSDALGRRRMIIGASLLGTVLAALCAVTTNGWLLVGERLVQGLAAGGAVAVGRAVVNDISSGRTAAALFGTLSSVSLIAPVVAPGIGGLLVSFGSWRLVFWFLTVVGLVVSVAAVTALPESLPAERRQPGGLTHLRARTRDLLADRHFSTPVLVQCLVTGGFLIYIGGSSFVLQDDLGISAQRYAAVFTGCALTMVASSVLFRVLVHRTGAVVLRRAAMTTQTTGVVLLFVSTLLAPGHRPPLALAWAALATMTAGLGMYLPSNAAIAQAAGRRSAGTASALGGGLPFLAGSVTSPLTGLLGHETLLTMASCMVVLFLLAAVTAVATRRFTVAEDAHPPVGADRPLGSLAVQGG